MTPAVLVCDESGSEGERLVGATTTVFAHAAVRLDHGEAAAVIDELRRLGPTPAVEYKANHTLRARNRAALLWLLDPAGPLPGRADVLLVDKAAVVVDRLCAALLGEPGTPLYLAGRRSPGPAWQDFLAAANALLRSTVRRGDPPSVEGFLAAATALGPLGERLAAARPRIVALRTYLRAHPTVDPPLDPLVAAVVRAVERAGPGPVTVVHDRHVALTPATVAQIRRRTGGRLAALHLADSRDDPRVQLADVLAGVAGRVAGEVLAGHPDQEATLLLAPLIDPASFWPAPLGLHPIGARFGYCASPCDESGLSPD